MALLKYGDRVREITDTEGSNPYALNGTTDASERTFVEGIGDQEWCYYCCEGLDDWEIGYGQIISGSPATLSRDTILASSNNDLAVPWGVGSKTIFNTATAAALDHVAGFVINKGNVSFNRKKVLATAGQTDFAHIYLRGALEVYVDGGLVAESEYSAIDGATIVFNSALAGGEIVEFIAVGQYTASHTQYETPVPTGQLFKSGWLLNNVYRNEAAAQDGIATNCTRYKWSGIEGDGIYLNGTDSKVDFTDFGLDHSAPFTFAFWFKTAATLADACVVSNQSGLDADGYLHIKTTAAGNLVVAVLDDAGAEQTLTHTITADTEYHIVVQYDGTDLSLWVDGVEDTPLTTIAATATPTNDLALGYKVNGSVDYSSCYLAGINIYESHLSAEAIANIYSEPDGPNSADIPAVVVPGSSVATNDDIIAMVIALG